MMDRAEDGGWRDGGRGREGGGENGGKAEYAQRRGCCYIHCYYMSSDGETLHNESGRELHDYDEYKWKRAA